MDNLCIRYKIHKSGSLEPRKNDRQLNLTMTEFLRALDLFDEKHYELCSVDDHNRGMKFHNFLNEKDD